MKKAIIIGATSGIGKSLAFVLSREYELGLAGRRLSLLQDLQGRIKTKTYIKKIDVTKTDTAMKQLESFIKKIGDVDLIIICAGVLYQNRKLDWPEERKTIETNILGFLAMANTAVKYFSKRGSGHIVGISSIASLKYSSRSTAYCASKAFISNYMEGLRQKLKKNSLDICVTDILPGFVDTPMIKKTGPKFWVATPKKAALQIYKAIKQKKKKVYVTRRWRFVAWLLRILPDWLKRLVF